MRRLLKTLGHCLLPCIFFHLLLAHQAAAFADKAHTLQIEPPKGYSEVDAKNGRNYLTAVMQESSSQKRQLRRFFLPKSDISLLQSGEYDKLTQGLALFELDAAFFRDLVGDLSTESVAAEPGNSLQSLIFANKSKIEAFMADRTLKPPFPIGLAPERGGRFVYIFLQDVPGHSMGIQEGPLCLASVLLLCEGKAFEICFFRKLNRADDVESALADAVAWLKSQTGQCRIMSEPATDYAGIPFQVALWKACVLLEEGKTAEALALYDNITLDMKHVGVDEAPAVIAASTMADGLMVHGNFQEAITILESTREKADHLLGDNSLSLLFNRAIGGLHVQNREYEQARPFLIKVLQENVPSVHNFGAAAARLQLAAANVALKDYKKAVDLLPAMLADLHHYAILRDSARTVYICCAQAQQGAGLRAQAVFFAKLALATAREQHKDNVVPDEIVTRTALYLDNLLEENARQEEKKAVAQYLDKGLLNRLMTEREQAALARYKTLSTAIEAATDAGQDEDLHNARQALGQWLAALKDSFK